MANNKSQPLAPLARAISGRLPDEYERAIHRAVMIAGEREQQVAARHRISVAQVQHIVLRVEHWLVQVQLPISIRYVLSKHVARLEHQWREAMAAWYRSCEDEVVVKTSDERSGSNKASGADVSPAKSAAGLSPACPRRNPGSNCEAHRRDAGATKSEAGATGAGATKDVKEKSKSERTIRRSCGDARYLEQARKILAEIRALSAAAVDFDEKKVKVDVTDLSDHERATLAGQLIATAREQMALDVGE